MTTAVERQRYAVVVAVLLDLFAVSLVLPLLPLRFVELGVSKKANGLIGSVYSAAQIVGGVALGWIGDEYLGRRGLLLVSFGGAAVSYAIVGMPGATLATLVCSRVIVGLCKQTMTASTAIMSELTSVGAERALWIGRISTASQLAWIGGQSIGGWLNATFDPWLISVVAVCVYAVDALLVVSALPSSSSQRARRTERDWRALFGSASIAAVAVAKIAAQSTGRAVGNSRDIYEIERWHLERSDLAYLKAIKSVIGLVVSWQLAGKAAASFGFWTVVAGSAAAPVAGSLVEAVPGHVWFACDAEASFLDKICQDPSLLVYTLLLFPLNAASVQVSSIAVRSKFTDVVHPSQTAAALGALDVLLNLADVPSPLLGGLLFDLASHPRHQPLAAAAIHLIGLLGTLAAAAAVPNPTLRSVPAPPPKDD